MENIELCIDCKKRPILNKKRKLCGCCYQRLRMNVGRLLSPDGYPHDSRTQKKYSNQREVDFIKNYFTHSNWIYHPAFFKMDGESYSPDFYDAEKNVFIEVSGSRQAYHQNKEKYEKFKRYYPQLKFEIRNPNGDLISDLPKGQKWAHQYESTG